MQTMNQKISFIAEQDGEVEQQFKNRIVAMLLKLKKRVRVYLVQVQYEKIVNEFNIAICYSVEGRDFDETILNETDNIFKSQFGSHEHLDIIFLEFNQEKKLRAVCCPFFTAHSFQVQQPDFYLVSRENSSNTTPVACFKRKKLMGVNPRGYLLCDIKPSIIGQRYGLGEKNIEQLIFVCRHENTTLFPISEWPICVYVTRSLVGNIEHTDYIKESDIELMFWGELVLEKNTRSEKVI